MFASSATCCSVSPRSLRSSRSRRRTRMSIGSSSLFACMARKLGKTATARHPWLMDTNWDCIVVGGGAAGLSAALVLGRARRRTLVDRRRGAEQPRRPRDRGPARPGRPPARCLLRGGTRGARLLPERRAPLRRGRRRRARDGGIVSRWPAAERERARRVLLATGMDYRRPELAGHRGALGPLCLPLPFCHGWEVRDRPLGVLDRGDSGVRRALLLRVWSDDVTLYSRRPGRARPR